MQFKINEPECHGCGVIKLPGTEEIAFHKHPELLWLFFPKVLNTVKAQVNLNQSSNSTLNKKGRCIIVQY